MDFTNFFFGGNDGPDYDIGNSLRFRNELPTYLTNTELAGSTLEDYTISVWVKKGNVKNASSQFIITSGTAGTVGSQLGYNNGGVLPAFNFIEMDGNTATGENFRCQDSNGWYHIVASNKNGPGASGAPDGPKQSLWVNGIKYGEASGTSSINLFSQSPVQIGLYADAAYKDTAWEGYMADFYFIDGDALPPTVFGGYNESGVWEPRDPEFEVNFQKYSAGVVSSSGSWFGPGYDNTAMFDGDVSVYCQTLNEGDTATFTPLDGIEYTSSVRVYSNRNAPDVLSLNGGADISLGAAGVPGWTEVATGTGTIESMAFSGYYGGSVCAIEVDGEILIDGPRWSNDLYAVNDENINTPPFDTTLKEFYDGGPVTTADKAFDGDSGTYAGATNPGTWLVYRPSTPITVKNKIKFQSNWALSDAYINEQQISISGGQEVFDLDFTGELTNLTIRGQIGSFAGTLLYLEIDGKQLIDGQGLVWGPAGFHLDFSDPSDIGRDTSGNGNHFTPFGFDLFAPSVATNLYRETFRDYSATVNTDNLLDSTPYSPSSELTISTSEMLLFVLAEEVTSIDVVWNGGGGGIQAGGTTWAVSQTGNQGTWTTVINNEGVEGVVPISNGGNPFRYIRAGAGTSWGFGSGVQGPSDKASRDYDLVKDSPTNNYATTNLHLPQTEPYYLDTDQVEYAMLAGSTNTGVYKSHRATIPPDHDCYWEVTYGSSPSSAVYSGLGTNTTDMGNTTEGFWGYNTANGSSGEYVVDGQVESTGVAPVFNIGDVSGFYWEYNDEQLTMYKNGAQIGQISTSNRNGRQLFIHHRPYGGDTFFVNYGQKPFQFRPAGLDGTSELSTQNMAPPTIRDGTAHFVALQGAGQGANGTPVAGQTAGSFSKDVFGGTSTTYEPNTVEKQFLPGAGGGYPPANMFDGNESTICKTGNGNAQTWIYFRPEGGITGVTSLVIQTSNAQTVIINDGEPTGQTSGGTADTYDIEIANPPSTLTSIAIQGNTISSATISKITINGNVLVDFDIMTQAQRTFPEGLWWIKSRSGTDQHQIGDFRTGLTVVSTSPTISQATPYVAPTEIDVMAWCWNAADPATSGFNIVEYNGQNPTVTTIEHGLTKAPEFIITMAKSGTTRNYAIYHKSLGAGKWLQLNDLENALDDTTMWNNTEPTNTTFQVGAANTTNFNGGNYMAYCWTSVPGFSAFGTYKGNGQDENGPYEWLGFEPACIMFKRTNARTNWLIFDNNRNPINTQNEGVALYPDRNEAEGGGYKIDFLSTGFKIRGSESLWNDTAGSEYIYCAWAKHPFNSPGLAR